MARSSSKGSNVGSRALVAADFPSPGPSPDRLPAALVSNVVYRELTRLAFTHDMARMTRERGAASVFGGLDGLARRPMVPEPQAFVLTDYEDWVTRKRLERVRLPLTTFQWPEVEFTDSFVKDYESLWVNPITKYLCDGDLSPPWERDGFYCRPAPFDGAVSLYKAAVERVKGIPAHQERPKHFFSRKIRVHYEKSHFRQFSDAYRVCRLLFADGVNGVPVNFEDVCVLAENHYGHDSGALPLVVPQGEVGGHAGVVGDGVTEVVGLVQDGVADEVVMVRDEVVAKVGLPQDTRVASEVGLLQDTRFADEVGLPIPIEDGVAGEVRLGQVGMPIPILSDNEILSEDEKKCAASSIADIPVVLPPKVPVILPIDSFDNVASLPPKSTDTFVKKGRENRKKVELLKLHSSCKTHPLAATNRYFEGTPRVLGSAASVRPDRDRTPSHQQIASLIKKVIPSPADLVFQESMHGFMKPRGDHVYSGDTDFVGVNIGRTPVTWLEKSFQRALPTFALLDEDDPLYNNDNDGYLHPNVTAIDFVGDGSPFKKELVRPDEGCNTSYSCLRFYVVTAVLNRRFGPVKKLADPVMDAAQVRHVMATKESHLDDEFDKDFRAVLVINPDLGFFYSSRDVYLEGVDGNFGSNTERGHLPIPISALRLRRSDGLPALGGYVKSFEAGFAFEAFLPEPGEWEGCVLKTKVLHAIQVADNVGPPLPPNVFQGCDVSKLDLQGLRKKYRDSLNSSGSRKINGRHFVEGAHYHKLDDERLACCKIIDPRKNGNIDLRIGVHETYTKLKRKVVAVPLEFGDGDEHLFGIEESSFLKYDGTRMQEETVVQIRDVLCKENVASLKVLNDNAYEAATEEIRVSGPKGSCRCESGDLGLMVPLGNSLVDRLSPDTRTYAATERGTNLPATAAAATGIANQYFPGHLRAIQQTEKEVGIEEADCFLQENIDSKKSPDQRAPSCIICSCNLQNASHYDPNDATVGLAIWTCLHGEDGVGNWYFILPNVIGYNEDGSVYQGIAIRLYHGIAIAWDGRVLRHCTSLMDGVRDPVGSDIGVTGHVFSTYLGTKIAHVERYRQRHQELARAKRQQEKVKRQQEKELDDKGKDCGAPNKKRRKRGKRQHHR